MSCVECGHYWSNHTAAGGACAVSVSEEGGEICTCTKYRFGTEIAPEDVETEPAATEFGQKSGATEHGLHEIRCVYCDKVIRRGPKVLSAACTSCLEARQNERRSDTDLDDYLNDLRSHLERKQRRLKPANTSILDRILAGEGV